ncbi:MAG: MoxR family ATPase [Sneathiellales bacterium]|nr:MoxR family ATPase [Sneathiellales bacterium]
MNILENKSKTLSGSDFLSQIQERLEDVLLGRSEQVKLTLSAFVANGHVLLDGLPGVGKTVFAEAIARVLGLKFARVQFTSDLLPADLIGASVYEQNSGSFSFHKGPIFNEMLLIDEVNRAGPKLQSALLEAMAERQVSYDGHSYPLPENFFTIATRNPGQQLGTFPLPEAQLDRFLFRLELSYPDREIELSLLKLGERKTAIGDIEAVLNVSELKEQCERASQVTVRETLHDYVMNLLIASREDGNFLHGLSSRAGILLVNAAKAYAYLSGRDYVLPDDIQAVFPALTDHRLVWLNAQYDNSPASEVLLGQVKVP